MSITGWEQLAQFGMSGIIFFGFICVLKWVFDINKDILKDMSKERELSQNILQGFIQELKQMKISREEFAKNVRDDHVRSQKQHEEMIIILGRINGYNKD